MRTGCHALGVLLLACGALAAQAQFDVVSIKPAPPTGLPAVIASLLMIRSGRVEAAGITAVDLIAQAYRQDGATLRLSRIVDAPAWATNERYAFTATFEGSTDVATLRERLPYMYRAVLQDRFKL